MASGVYNCFKEDCMTKTVNLSSDTIKVGLLNNSHAFTATNTVWSDVSANEVSGAGYSTGGGTMSGKAVTVGATTKWTATDQAWGASTITAYHAVIYDTSNSNSLIASIDFGGAKVSSSGTFTIQWAGAGIITIA